MFLEITNEQINEAINKLIDGSINLGGKILGALIIFIIGKFIVNWINKLFAAMLQKRKVDASIQSFLKSIVNSLSRGKHVRFAVLRNILLPAAIYLSRKKKIKNCKK